MEMRVSKEFDSCFRPAVVASDMPLLTEKPVDFALQGFCEHFRICADARPGGAITKKVNSPQRNIPMAGR